MLDFCFRCHIEVMILCCGFVGCRYRLLNVMSSLRPLRGGVGVGVGPALGKLLAPGKGDDGPTKGAVPGKGGAGPVFGEVDAAFFKKRLNMGVKNDLT